MENEYRKEKEKLEKREEKRTKKEGKKRKCNNSPSKPKHQHKAQTMNKNIIAHLVPKFNF